MSSAYLTRWANWLRTITEPLFPPKILQVISMSPSINLLQVLIVDDASTDRTTEVAIEYSKNNANTIRILKLGENHGKGGAVKLGVGKARGKYILMVRTFGLDQYPPYLVILLV